MKPKFDDQLAYAGVERGKKTEKEMIKIEGKIKNRKGIKKKKEGRKKTNEEEKEWKKKKEKKEKEKKIAIKRENRINFR